MADFVPRKGHGWIIAKPCRASSVGFQTRRSGQSRRQSQLFNREISRRSSARIPSRRGDRKSLVLPALELELVFAVFALEFRASEVILLPRLAKQTKKASFAKEKLVLGLEPMGLTTAGTADTEDTARTESAEDTEFAEGAE